MPLKKLPVYLLLAAVSAVAACASGGAPGATTSDRPSSTRRDPNVITSEELAAPAMSALSVYDAIRTLRPNFLASRGTQVVAVEGHAGLVDTESGKVHASIDGSGVLALDELKRLHVAGVVEIRFLSAAAAMQKFGGSAKEGPVILVRTL